MGLGHVWCTLERGAQEKWWDWGTLVFLREMRGL